MTKLFGALGVTCVFALAACGGSDAQMLSAVRESVAAFGEKNPFGSRACLPLPLADAVTGDDAHPQPIFEEIPATSATLQTLAAHGLLRAEAPVARGRPRFGVTPEGSNYLRVSRTSHFVNAWEWAMCTGTFKVTDLESFTKPADLLGQTISSVNYRYVVEGAADWAKDPQVQALNPNFARHFRQPISRMDLVHTNKGWRSIYIQQRDAGLVR